MRSLATELFREIRPGLFRVLGGRNAATYIDVLDSLEKESAQRHNGMSREEALSIISHLTSPSGSPDVRRRGFSLGGMLAGIGVCEFSFPLTVQLTSADVFNGDFRPYVCQNTSQQARCKTIMTETKNNRQLIWP